MGRVFVLVFVGLFIAASCPGSSDPTDSPWTTALSDGDDGDVDTLLDGAVDTGRDAADALRRAASRSRLPDAPATATRPYSTTPHDKRAPPVL
jgi:hypothetical protein